ncbi:MAG: CHAT domain-containing protein [Saprospiraceae bacterium]|nr:CHAT domain-containing protein [Saprospiraceae bacterium]
MNRFYSRKNVETLSLIRACEKRLSSEYTLPSLKRDSVNLTTLQTKLNELNKDLAIKAFRNNILIKSISWIEVQNELKFNDVSIEFVHYKYFNIEQIDSINYAALVLLPNDTSPHFIPLFEEKELNQLLSTSQSRRMDYVADLYHSSNDRGALPSGSSSKTLYELIWQPLEPYLKGVNKIYFSPSGLLHRINQNAVAINDQTLLSDKYDLVQLGSTRQLVTDENVKEAKIHTACIYGGINFEMDSTALLASIHKMDSNSIALRSELSFSYTDSTLRGATWSYLKGSEDEANEINKIIQKTGIKSILFKGNEATEAGFKKLGDYNTESPQVIHVSSHGYFFPDPKVSHQATILSLQQEPVFKMSEHPMLRSGLILAGANHAWKTGKPITPEAEDGILTAYEISQLNLRNTELVVLSACETGLGDIQGNEGVYGLQRAFKIAGAKNLIMSLWQVPDKQTSELMTAFYKYWLIKKKSIRESLKLAQNDLRKKGLESFYWAGFVLVE